MGVAAEHPAQSQEPTLLRVVSSSSSQCGVAPQGAPCSVQSMAAPHPPLTGSGPQGTDSTRLPSPMGQGKPVGS